MSDTKNKWAQYASKEFEPKILINRFDDNKGTRFYWWSAPDGQVFTGAGITSLISKVRPENKWLTDWKLYHGKEWKKVLNAYSEYGTMLHIAYLHWMTKREVPKEFIDMMKAHCEKWGQSQDMPEKNILAFVKFEQDYKLVPLIIEGQLSATYRSNTYCMTIDLLCKVEAGTKTKQWVQDGVVQVKKKRMVDTGEVYKAGAKKGQPKMIEKNVVVSETPKMVEKNVVTKEEAYALTDFKSNFGDKASKNFYDDNKFQLMAAKEAIKQNFGIDVKYLINFSPDNWTKAPSYTTKQWDVTEYDWREFNCYMELCLIKGHFVPSGNKMVFPKFNENTKPTDFKRYGYVEYVQAFLLPQSPESQNNEAPTLFTQEV